MSCEEEVAASSSSPQAILSKRSTTLSQLRTTRRLLWKWIVLIGVLVVLTIYRYRVTMTSIVVLNDPVEIHGQTTTTTKKKKKTSNTTTTTTTTTTSNTTIEKKVKKPEIHSLITKDKKKHPQQQENKTLPTHVPNDENKTITNSASEKKKSKEKKKSGSKHNDTLSKKETRSNNTTKSHSKNETTTTKPNQNDTIIKLETNETKESNKTKMESKHSTTTEPTTPAPTVSESTSTPVQSKNNNNNNTTASTSLIPPYNKTKAAEFTNSSCLLTNTEWFPSSSDEQWQLRAPRFMILGARDAGTRLISSQLLKHSSIISNSHPKQELGYFSQPTFLKKQTPQQQQQQRTFFVWKARQRMYARDYPSKILKANSSLITMDATPDYLFYSSTTPTSILCTCPWILVVVVLSNPATRVYESYKRATQKLGWKGSLDDYVRLDMETMERAGWIGSTTTTTTTSGSNANTTRQEAYWNLYLSYSTTHDGGPVGRSFYEIQLQEWFRVLRDMGRSVEEAVHVIRLEEWMKHPDTEYQRLLSFLGLPIESVATSTASSIDSLAPNNNNNVNLTKEDELTMSRLKKFFRPYNKRLYKLLGKDWDGCWDD